MPHALKLLVRDYQGFRCSEGSYAAGRHGHVRPHGWYELYRRSLIRACSWRGDWGVGRYPPPLVGLAVDVEDGVAGAVVRSRGCQIGLTPSPS